MEKIKKILILIMIASILMMYLYSRNIKEEKDMTKNDDYNLISFTIDGKKSNMSFPKKDSGYVVNSVSCKDNVLASWDDESWKLIKESKTSEKVNCVVDFSDKKQIN